MTHSITLPQNAYEALKHANIGDSFTFTATATVEGISAELIDVTRYGQPPESEFIRGEQTIELHLSRIELGTQTEASA